MATYITVYSGCTYGVRADFSIADDEVERLDADGEWLPTGKPVSHFDHDWQAALKAELSADDPLHPDDINRMNSAIRHAISDDRTIKKVMESLHIGIYSICNRFVAIALDTETLGYGYYQLADGDVIDLYDKTVCEQQDGRLIRRKMDLFGDSPEAGTEDVIYFAGYDYGNGHETFESIAEKITD